MAAAGAYESGLVAEVQSLDRQISQQPNLDFRSVSGRLPPVTEANFTAVDCPLVDADSTGWGATRADIVCTVRSELLQTMVRILMNPSVGSARENIFDLDLI